MTEKDEIKSAVGPAVNWLNVTGEKFPATSTGMKYQNPLVN